MSEHSTTQIGRRIGKARLIVDNGDHQGMVYPLTETVVSIGRGPENTIQLIDSKMSRNHSVLIANGLHWYARDLASKNGTIVNNEEIHGDRLLAHGDGVRVGNTLFLFECDTPEIADDAEDDIKPSAIEVFEDNGLVEPSHVMKMENAATTELSLHAKLSGSPRDKQRLTALHALTTAIGSVLNLKELLQVVLEMSQDLLTPDRSAIMLAEGDRRTLVPKATLQSDSSAESIVLSDTILTRAVTDRVAILVSDAPRDFRFKASDSIAIQRINSAICAPLIYKGDVLGVIYFDSRKTTNNYNEDDVTLVSVIANQAAIAIANTRMHRQLMENYAQERELEIARTIQESLLPKQMPRLANFTMHAMTRPAKMVGGDYYDIIPLDEHRWLLVVADVSGKGIPAAILIAAVRSAVQVEARSLAVEKLRDVIERLNDMVCRDTTNNMFVTMFAGVLNTQERSFTFCNAGHAYPLLCHEDGGCEALETGGTFLGIVSGMAFEEDTILLEPGSKLVIFTDGVTDVMNSAEEMFGHVRLRDLLIETHNLPTREQVDKIIEVTAEWQGDSDPFDDFTLLALQSNP